VDQIGRQNLQKLSHSRKVPRKEHTKTGVEEVRGAPQFRHGEQEELGIFLWILEQEEQQGVRIFGGESSVGKTADFFAGGKLRGALPAFLQHAGVKPKRVGIQFPYQV
jgi:hypothetical protein